MAASDSAGARRFEPAEYKLGDTTASNDFIFRKIGVPLPLKSSASDFDLRSAPIQALAVSEHFHLLFLAHSEGFYVVRTKDAIEAAKMGKDEGKLSSVEEVSVLDVPIGRVSILSLSLDSSLLAACVAETVHFFSIRSLLNKDREPSFSCSLPDPGLVKDLKWRSRMKTSFVVLSTMGKLYVGEKRANLKDVMDGVDAVDWSLNGDYMVVVKDSALRLLSSDIEELFFFPLAFETVMDITDAISVKVDLIKWVRDDSIIIGCLQLSEDEVEEGYVMMVIQTKKTNIVEDPSQVVVSSFSELFTAVVDDVLPCGSGPYMFISYLEKWELALAANRKNTDQHIVSLQWSLVNNQSDAVVVDFGQDKDVPRIELTESGDDNIILGFGVDKASVNENIEVKMDDAERHELSPHCILLCLSSDGKLVMFYVARISEIPKCQHTSDIAGGIQNSSVPADELLSDVSTGNDTLIADSRDSAISPSQPSIPMGDLSHKQRDSLTSCKSDTQSQSTEHAGVLDYRGEAASRLGVPASPSNQTVYGEKHRSLEVDKAPTGPASSSTTAYGLRPASLSTGSALLSKDSSESDSRSYPDQASLQLSFKNSLESERVTKLKGISGSNNPALKYSHSFENTSSANKSVLPDPSPSSLSVATTKLQTTKLSAGNAFSSPGLAGSTSSFSVFGSFFSQNSTAEKFKAGAFSGTDDVTSDSFQSGNSASFNANLPSASSSAIKHVIEQKAPSLVTNVIGPTTPTSNVCSSSTGKIPKYTGSMRPLHYSLNRYNAPKMPKSCNVNEMLEEMDALLSDVEDEGGFKDACTFFQESSVLNLEQGLEKLSERCRNWKNISDQHRSDIQHLQAKTVQVLTRKIYIEGFMKQATDKHYWEYWDLQKLNPEFEIKKLHLEKLHQNMISQLINLERHFNTLELNKYGEGGIGSMSRNMYSDKQDGKRSFPSLHSLYNTMNSQLAVAEKLSECLSKQMAVLKIDSPPTKQTNVTKELFASIGLTCIADETYNSPNVKKIGSKLDSMKEFSSLLKSNKERSARYVSTAFKEPETARRRRDSLDKSWTSFEPKKTTVKRMFQERIPKVRLGKSSFESTRELINSENGDHLIILSSKEPIRPSFTLPSTTYQNDSLFEKQESGKSTSQNLKSTSEGYFKWAKEPLRPSQQNERPSPVEVSTTKQTSSGDSNSITGHSAVVSEPKQITSLKSSGESMTSIISDISRKDIHPQKHTLNKPAQASGVPKMKSGGSALLSTSNDASGPSSGYFEPNTRSKVPVYVGTSSAAVTAVGTLSPSSSINYVFPLSSSSSLEDSKLIKETSSISPINSIPLTRPETPSLTPSKGDQFSAFSSLVSSLPHATNTTTTINVSASTASPTISTSPFSLSGTVPIQPKNSEIASFELPSQERQAVVNSPSTTSDYRDASQPETTASVLSGIMASVGPSVSQTALNQATSFTTSSNVFAASSPVLPSESESTIAVSSLTASDVNANRSQDSSLTSFNINMPPGLVISSERANDVLDLSNSQEDVMEEEALDSSTELGLSALGGFGLGSVPAMNIPSSNPFGGPFSAASANPMNSQVPLTIPSGELFRPPSFSLPSPSPPQPSQPTNQGAFSGAFGANIATSSGFSGFGQPAQIGAGQHALGSVLGTFGQSRQLGSGLPGVGFGVSGGFGGGGAPNSAGGGFASVGSGGGGFAALASGGGGFAAAAASASSGGGFAACGSRQSGGNFSAFGGSNTTPSAIPDRFTQMRK